jgi:queuine tRNA-ribosyltransferase
LRHLITTKNLLGARLLSLHNLAFYMQLLGEMRTAIAQDRFDVWRREWSVHYAAPTSDATESAA